MDITVPHYRPRNIMSPGRVGSIGETSYQIRLKQSAPDLDPRYSKTFNAENIAKRAKTTDTRANTYITPHQKRTAIGFFKQDIIPTDNSLIAQMGELGNYQWNNQKAQVLKAKVTGDSFLPPPGVYDKSIIKNSITRGNTYPQPILIDSGQKSKDAMLKEVKAGEIKEVKTEKNTVGLYG